MRWDRGRGPSEGGAGHVCRGCLGHPRELVANRGRVALRHGERQARRDRGGDGDVAADGLERRSSSRRHRGGGASQRCGQYRDCVVRSHTTRKLPSARSWNCGRALARRGRTRFRGHGERVGDEPGDSSAAEQRRRQRRSPRRGRPGADAAPSCGTSVRAGARHECVAVAMHLSRATGTRGAVIARTVEDDRED